MAVPKVLFKIEHTCSLPFCCQEESAAEDRRQLGQVFPLKVEFILLATYTTRLANVFKSKRGILPTATFSHWQASLEALQLPFVWSDTKLLSELLSAVPFRFWNVYALKLSGRVTNYSTQLFKHARICDCKEIINIFSYSWVVQTQHLSVGTKICETKLHDRACFVKTQMSHKICCLAA